MKCIMVMALMGSAAWATLASGADLQVADGGAPFRAGWQEVRFIGKPAEKPTKEPRYGSRRPLYAAIPFGRPAARRLWVVLDESAGSGKGYDRMWVDVNGNDDLSDEVAIPARVSTTGGLICLDTHPVAVSLRYDGGVRRVLKMGMEVRGTPQKGSREVVWSITHGLEQHIEGLADLGVRRGVRVGFYDSNDARQRCNGGFNDYGIDRLRIDLNGDGKLDETSEDFSLTRVLALDGKLWTLELDAAATAVRTIPCPLPSGYVKFAWSLADGARTDGGMVTLSGMEQPDFAFAGTLSVETRLLVPEGSYLLTNSTWAVVDKSGQRWLASFTGRESVMVRADQETVVKIGAPFQAIPLVEGALKPGVASCILLDVKGAGGEIYRNIAPEKSRMMPKMRILDAEDVVVAQGNMEYG